MENERRAWWRCFEQISGRLLEKCPENSKICIDVLFAENISEDEAWEWLDTECCHQTALSDVVRQYYFMLTD